MRVVGKDTDVGAKEEGGTNLPARVRCRTRGPGTGRGKIPLNETPRKRIEDIEIRYEGDLWQSDILTLERFIKGGILSVIFQEKECRGRPQEVQERKCRCEGLTQWATGLMSVS